MNLIASANGIAGVAPKSESIILFGFRQNLTRIRIRQLLDRYPSAGTVILPEELPHPSAKAETLLHSQQT